MQLIAQSSRRDDKVINRGCNMTIRLLRNVQGNGRLEEKEDSTMHNVNAIPK